MTDSTKKQEVKETTEKVMISGISIMDLLNPKLIEELEKEKISLTPFLIAIDIDKNLLTISHSSPNELTNKMIHVECRDSSGAESPYIKKISDILKKLVR